VVAEHDLLTLLLNPPRQYQLHSSIVLTPKQDAPQRRLDRREVLKNNQEVEEVEAVDRHEWGSHDKNHS
jgi:hypothetical protein